MSRAVETLDTQIEEDNKTRLGIQNALRYNHTQIAHCPTRWEEHRIKIEQENIYLRKQDIELAKAIGNRRDQKAKYFHELDMLTEETRVKQEKIEAQAAPSDVTLEPREREFLNSLK